MNLSDTIATNEKIIDLILKKNEVSKVYELRGPDLTYANRLSEDNAKAQKYLATVEPK